MNSVGPDLDLKVGHPKIAMSIFEKGGQDFQSTLLSDNPEGIKFGDMVVAAATGNLSCKWVFNCCLEKHANNKKSKEVRSVAPYFSFWPNSYEIKVDSRMTILSTHCILV